MDEAFDEMQKCKRVNKYPGTAWAYHFRKMVKELKEAVDCYEEALEAYKDESRARST